MAITSDACGFEQFVQEPLLSQEKYLASAVNVPGDEKPAVVESVWRW